MADENSWRPGDDTNVMLRKILNRLEASGGGGGGGGGGGAVTVTSGNIDVDSVAGLVTVTGSVTSVPSQGSLTDGSDSISTGGASQEVFAANSARKYLIVQNISTENMWINFGSAAAADSTSLKLLPNGSFVMEGSFISTQQVNIVSATTGSKFVAKEG